jgi:hypothetical protein
MDMLGSRDRRGWRLRRQVRALGTIWLDVQSWSAAFVGTLTGWAEESQHLPQPPSISSKSSRLKSERNGRRTRRIRENQLSEVWDGHTTPRTLRRPALQTHGGLQLRS